MTNRPQAVNEMLALARADAKRLSNPKSVADAKAAWSSFLEHSNRAINRLEGFARRNNREADYKALIKRIWQDPLASYMRTARNTHEHGVDEISVPDSHPERIRLPDGYILNAPNIFGTTADGRQVAMTPVGPMRVEGEGHQIISMKPTIVLGPVQTRQGDWILCPIPQLTHEQESVPSAAARVYLSWVEQAIDHFMMPHSKSPNP